MLIGQISSLAKQWTNNDDYSTFLCVNSKTTVIKTVVGKLFTDESLSKGLKLTQKRIHLGQSVGVAEQEIAIGVLDDTSRNRLKTFIINCSVGSVREIVRNHISTNRSEKAYLKDRGCSSVDQFKPIVEMDDAELRAPLNGIHNVNVTTHCYCPDMTIISKFRIGLKLLKIIKSGQIRSAREAEHWSALNPGNLKRHLSTHKKLYEQSQNSTNRNPTSQRVETLTEVVIDQPKTFIEEDENTQRKLILEWLLNSPVDEYLHKHKTIDNITLLLENMKANGYLRIIQNIDLEIIKEYCSETSWEMIETFRENRTGDELKCSQCSDNFENINFWKCMRCFHVYHSKCCASKIITRKENEQYSLCTGCFFQIDSINFK